MEKRVYQIRCAIKNKTVVKTRRIYNVMAKNIEDAKEILREKWSPLNIEVLNVLNKWSLEEYIIIKSCGGAGGELLYKLEEF